MAVAVPLTISEEWVRAKADIQHDKLEDVRSLALPGTYQEKITNLGSALKKFSRLKNLDLSRNALQSLEGLENCKHLETLNLYYNNIATLDELHRLSRNGALKDIDLRLNPVTRNEPDYRLYLIHALPQLEKLDDRPVRQSERDTAASYYGVDQEQNDDDAAAAPAGGAGAAAKARSSATRAVPSRFAVSTLDDDDRAVLDFLAKGQESKPSGDRTGGPAAGFAAKVASSEDYDLEDVRRMESEEHQRHARASGGSSGSSGAALQPRRPQLRQDNTAPRLAPDGSAISFGDDAEPTSASGGLYRREMEAYTAYQGQGMFTPNPELDDPAVASTARRSGDMKASGDGGTAVTLSGPLEALLDLVDKYWNGTKSLHTNQRFLKLASATLGQKSAGGGGGAEPSSGASERLSSLHDEIRRLKEENELLSNVAKQARNPSSKRNKELAASGGLTAAASSTAAELQEALDRTGAEVEMLKKKLQESLEENRRLREHVTAASSSDALSPQHHTAAATARAESGLRREVEELRRENHHAQIRLKQYAQMQELATMLQESHKSLVHTNDHLLKEIEEMRRKHYPDAEEISPGKRGYQHYSSLNNGN